MEDSERKPSGKREITYRVGWKTGRLEIGENGKVTGAESAVVFMERKLWLRILDKLVWRSLPQLSSTAIAVMLWTLPAIGFGLTWWLVFLLSRAS